jgi:hypothetical protein
VPRARIWARNQTVAVGTYQGTLVTRMRTTNQGACFGVPGRTFVLSPGMGIVIVPDAQNGFCSASFLWREVVMTDGEYAGGVMRELLQLRRKWGLL